MEEGNGITEEWSNLADVTQQGRNVNSGRWAPEACSENKANATTKVSLQEWGRRHWLST